MTSRHRGYTLLELMVAAAILALGLTAVARAFTSGLASVQNAEHRAIATALAQQRLAEIEALETLDDGTTSGFVSEPWEAYRWESLIETMEQYPNLKKVRITVGRPQGTAIESVTLEAIVRVPPEPEEGSSL